MRLLWIAILLVMLMLPLRATYAMGPPPSACNNLYYATIRSAVISYPGGTLDAIANPNATITMQADQTYDVTLVVHTASQSVNNNTLVGTIYFDYNNIVYVEHECFDPKNNQSQPSTNVTSIGPNMSVELKFTGIQRNQINVNPQYLSYSVLSSAQASSTIYYGIDWVTATSTTTTSSSFLSSSVSSSSSSSSVSLSSSSSTSSSTTTSTSHSIPEFPVGTGLMLSFVFVLGASLVVFRLKRPK